MNADWWHSVELLDPHAGWQVLPHTLFAADWWFQTILIFAIHVQSTLPIIGVSYQFVFATMI